MTWLAGILSGIGAVAAIASFAVGWAIARRQSDERDHRVLSCLLHDRELVGSWWKKTNRDIEGTFKRNPDSNLSMDGVRERLVNFLKTKGDRMLKTTYRELERAAELMRPATGVHPTEFHIERYKEAIPMIEEVVRDLDSRINELQKRLERPIWKW